MNQTHTIIYHTIKGGLDKSSPYKFIKFAPIILILALPFYLYKVGLINQAPTIINRPIKNRFRESRAYILS
jgi:hypothetical protein